MKLWMNFGTYGRVVLERCRIDERKSNCGAQSQIKGS